MTDEKVKRELDQLMCLLNFDTGATEQVLKAVRVVFGDLIRTGGGYRDLRLSVSGTSGQRMVVHSPAIIETVEKKVHRG